MRIGVDPDKTLGPVVGLIVETCLHEFCSQRRILGELPDVEFVPGFAGKLREEHRLRANGSGICCSSYTRSVSIEYITDPNSAQLVLCAWPETSCRSTASSHARVCR